MHVIWLTVFSLPEEHGCFHKKKVATMLTEKTSVQTNEMADFVEAYLPVYYFIKVLYFSYCYDGPELNLCYWVCPFFFFETDVKYLNT